MRRGEPCVRPETVRNALNRYEETGRHRRSIRLKDYDYSQSGAYFITICTHNRECLFGEIVGEDMLLNNAGTMVESGWNAIPDRFPGVSLDASIIMPNHAHGIIVIEDAAVGANLVFAQEPNAQQPVGANLVFAQDSDARRVAQGRIQDSPLRPAGTLPGTVGRIIQAYKSVTTHEYTVGVKQHGWPAFGGRIWQRNYYEHVIRGEKDLNALREYILNNPLKWALDVENPLRTR